MCLRHRFCLFLRFFAVLSEWYFLFFILLIIYYIILGIACDCILQYRRISTVLPWCHAVYHSESCQRLSFSTRYISGRIVKCRRKHLFRTGKILCRRFTYVLILSSSCCFDVYNNIKILHTFWTFTFFIFKIIINTCTCLKNTWNISKYFKQGVFSGILKLY